jgi:hypothetical protein
MLKFGMGYLYIYKIKSRYSKVKNFRTSKLSHTLQVVLIKKKQKKRSNGTMMYINMGYI